MQLVVYALAQVRVALKRSVAYLGSSIPSHNYSGKAARSEPSP